MNSVIIEKKDINESQNVTLSQVQSEHLISIVKVKVGDQLKATILDESLALTEVFDINNEKNIVTLKILATRPGLFFPIKLIIAASRPLTMKKVIEHGVSMGVHEFIIVGAKLTEKSYLQSKIYDETEFRELGNLGLSQSTCFFKSPKISLISSLKKLPHLNSSQKFILSPYADKTFFNQNLDLKEEIILAIGPERGWSHDEVEFFKDTGFRDVSISPSILRVEIATFASLAALNAKMLS